jgi:NADH-ubiquinone oxidoreductase chain 6
MLGINFIGISYLLVYVGAVSILFIFILMLINIRISELLSTTGNSIPLAIMITLSFYYPISQIISYNTAKFKILSLIPTDIFQIIDFISYASRIYRYNYGISFATSKN